jgi:hypothetical protein
VAGCWRCPGWLPCAHCEGEDQNGDQREQPSAGHQSRQHAGRGDHGGTDQGLPEPQVLNTRMQRISNWVGHCLCLLPRDSAKHGPARRICSRVLSLLEV